MTSLRQDEALEEFASMRVAELFRAVNDRIRELEASWQLNEHDFFCECLDEACTRVLRMSSDQFEALRSSPGHFAVLPGHERVGDIVISRGDHHLVVSTLPAQAAPFGTAQILEPVRGA